MIELHQSELMPEVWLTYKTPLIRQLAFSVASPNILSAVPEQLPIQHTFEFHANAFWQKHYQAISITFSLFRFFIPKRCTSF